MKTTSLRKLARFFDSASAEKAILSDRIRLLCHVNRLLRAVIRSPNLDNTMRKANLCLNFCALACQSDSSLNFCDQPYLSAHLRRGWILHGQCEHYLPMMPK
jgi:hypothetical protein